MPTTTDRKNIDVKGFWYILHEAPTVPEASALIPLAVPQWSKQIIATLIFGDLAQLPLLVPSNNHFNVFLAQLSMSLHKRLVTLGLREYAFTEQKRIHPAILPPLNAVFYQDSLPSAPGTWPKFPKGFADAAKHCFGLSTDVKLTKMQLRSSWMELNNTTVRKSAETGSSANYETHLFVMGMVKKLRCTKVRPISSLQLCPPTGVSSNCTPQRFTS